jgi:hypothetical protein
VASGPLHEDEEAWLQWVRDYARRACRPPWRTFHTRNSRGSDKGWLDLVLIRPPRCVYAELKTMEGRLTPEQRRTKADLEACGYEVYVWRPCDREEIARVLE